MLVIVISNIILLYLIDTFLVGMTFYCLKNRFQWHISYRTCMVILFIIFAFMEYSLLPMSLFLDLTFTVGNPDIAKFFHLRPNEPVMNLFGFGFFEIMIWAAQSLLAAFIGEKIIMKKSI